MLFIQLFGLETKEGNFIGVSNIEERMSRMDLWLLDILDVGTDVDNGTVIGFATSVDLLDALVGWCKGSDDDRDDDDDDEEEEEEEEEEENLLLIFINVIIVFFVVLPSSMIPLRRCWWW